MPDDEQPLTEEQRRAGAFRHIETAQQLTEGTARRLIGALEGSAPIRHIRGSQVISAVLGLVGFALLIHGIEKVAGDLPFVDRGYGAIVVGVIFLFASGLLLQKLIKGE